MKKNNFYVLFLGLCCLLVSACSKEEDPVSPTNSLENVDPMLLGEEITMEVPQALVNSSDPHAQQVNYTVALANSYNSLFGFFNPPPGAEKSNNPIGRTNGRLAPQEEVLVYEWDLGDGSFMAYQISESGTHYRFQLFYKLATEADYRPYLSSEQAKDRKSGKWEMFAEDEDNPGQFFAFYRGEWSMDSNNATHYTLDFYSAQNVVESSMELYSEEDLSGSLKISEPGEGRYEMVWDAAGNGTWQEFDASDNLIDSGSWTA